jgi:hypothetical protein
MPHDVTRPAIATYGERNANAPPQLDVSRAEQVRETFRGETVRAEQAYILPGDTGPLLVYVMEAEDFERGSKAFATSHHKIDAEHKDVMRECLGESVNVAPLYEVTLEANR